MKTDWVTRSAFVCFLILMLGGCQTSPNFPDDLNGKTAVVMGYSTDLAEPYEGGTLYTGMWIDKINGEELATPLKHYDIHILEPAHYQFDGTCFWRLRGNMRLEDDLYEPATYAIEMKADTFYILGVEIDEYKIVCDVSHVERMTEAKKAETSQ